MAGIGMKGRYFVVNAPDNNDITAELNSKSKKKALL
jgi:hypothetical protein